MASLILTLSEVLSEESWSARRVQIHYFQQRIKATSSHGDFFKKKRESRKNTSQKGIIHMRRK